MEIKRVGSQPSAKGPAECIRARFESMRSFRRRSLHLVSGRERHF